MTLSTFHGKQEVKDHYLKRIRWHIEADHLVRGTGWNGEKGCAVGCSLEKYDHKAYETEMGIPEWLAHVEDALFERMSEAKSRTWPAVFLEAIPVGADLEPVKGKFLVIVLTHVLTTFDHEKYADVKAAVERVRTLWLEGGSAKEFQEAAAWSAMAAACSARAAAAWAAWAADAAEAAAAWAARAAAWAADAAEAAADTSSDSASTCDHFANELLRLLRECEPESKHEQQVRDSLRRGEWKSAPKSEVERHRANAKAVLAAKGKRKKP